MSGRSKNHTLKGGTSPYSLCKGVPPWDKSHDTTPGGGFRMLKISYICNILSEG